MKLITLNIWGGQIYDPLCTFIQTYADTDIFCFQEVYKNAPQKVCTDDAPVRLNIFSELENLLPEHTGFFRPTVNGIYGIALFIKKKFPILEEGEIMIHHAPNYAGLGPTHSRNLQWIRCHANAKTYSIINVHGLWCKEGKIDTVDRIKQSTRIRDFMNQQKNPFVLCGDFNARPNTESISRLAQGMNNLIQTHNIQSTRTSLYGKDEPFADYVFTSNGINVHHFNVLNDVVSDHAPLMLAFD